MLRFYDPVNPIWSCRAQSVYLTTLLLGRHCPSWISGRERMTLENISWPISTKECCLPGGNRTRNLLITSRTRIQPSHRGQQVVEWPLVAVKSLLVLHYSYWWGLIGRNWPVWPRELNTLSCFQACEFAHWSQGPFRIICSKLGQVCKELTTSNLQTNTDTFANSVDPDETARNEPSQQNLHCLRLCYWFYTLYLNHYL